MTTASSNYGVISISSIDLSLVTFNWFLTAFVDGVPIEVCAAVVFSGAFQAECKPSPSPIFSPKIVLRIWDSLLYEGTKVCILFNLSKSSLYSMWP